MTNPSLEARNVSRAFGPLLAVDHVSLSIESGEIVVLLGKSGSGKSTLLRILAGLETVDSGEVFANGHLASSKSKVVAPEHRNVGMVFQDYALFPHLTAAANISFGLRNVAKSQRSDLATAWLNRIGLGSRGTYFPHQLSGGEQQRIALARALAPKPSVVLMDEPFSGLDPQLRLELQATTLETLRTEGVGALIVSHDASEAIGIADKIGIMAGGKLVQSGSPRDIYNNPTSLDVARALGDTWAITALAQNGVVTTDFGQFKTELTGPVTLAARPEATNILAAPDGPFTVTRAVGVGRFVTLSLQAADFTLRAQVEAALAPPIGSSVNVHVSPQDVLIFKA